MENLLALLKRNRPSIENYLWRSLQLFLKGILTVFILFIAAKSLSAVDFGIFNYLTALIALFVVFCDFGLSVSMSKYIAEHTALDRTRVNSILFSVLLLISGLCAFFTGILVLLGKYIFPAYYKYLLFFVPYMFFMPATSVLDGYYRGLKRFKDLCLCYLAVSLVSIPLSYILILRFSLLGAIGSLSLIYFLTTFLLISYKEKLPFSLDKKLLSQVGKYALFIGIANISYFMYTKVDILILKQFNYVVEIGYYAIIDKIFYILLLPSAILGQVIAPTVARYTALQDFGHLKRKYKKYISLLGLLAIPATLVLYIVIPLFMKLFLPEYYTGTFMAILKVLLLLFPLKIAGICAAVGFITPSGFVKITTISTLIGGALNICFDYLLISKLGFIGVFYTTLLVHSLTIIITNIVFFRNAFYPNNTSKGGQLAT